MSTQDLEAVEELCRLALVARRLGCRVRLEGAPDDLRALLSLAGVENLLLTEPPDLDPNPGDLR